MKILYHVLVGLPDKTTTQIDFVCTNFVQVESGTGFFRFELTDGKEVLLNKNHIIQVTEEKL